nr:VOC family protein [Streptomyces griseus]
MATRRMDHVGIVVEDMDAAAAIFEELGMELEDRGEVRRGFADHNAGRRLLPHRAEARP